MLGYGSAGELVRLSRELGLWREIPAESGTASVGLRRKDGTDLTVAALRAGGGSEPMVVAVIEGDEA
jgi:hypothetical protein